MPQTSGPSVAGAQLRAFVADPAPDAFATTVSRWSRRDQAQFLIGLGFALEECHGKRGAAERREFLANAIIAEERDLIDRHGTELILALAGILIEARTAEALS